MFRNFNNRDISKNYSLEEHFKENTPYKSWKGYFEIHSDFINKLSARGYLEFYWNNVIARQLAYDVLVNNKRIYFTEDDRKYSVYSNAKSNVECIMRFLHGEQVKNQNLQYRVMTGVFGQFEEVDKNGGIYGTIDSVRDSSSILIEIVRSHLGIYEYHEYFVITSIDDEDLINTYIKDNDLFVYPDLNKRVFYDEEFIAHSGKLIEEGYNISFNGKFPDKDIFQEDLLDTFEDEYWSFLYFPCHAYFKKEDDIRLVIYIPSTHDLSEYKKW
ncbi:MAG: hypothetical protein N2749_07100 [Clostridia bacterium]|nr:hypothetical protein [Clostridia bacterium]